MFKIFFFILLLLLTFPHSFAAKKVAQIVMLRGNVSMNYKGKKTKLKRNDWVYEHSKVLTKPKSFVRLLFKNKSTMNLGPKSEMEIASFPQKKAGIVSLIKGQLRSKVSKDILGRQKGSKLFVKTKTAAMGIRGTDFQVFFNNVNNVTSLVTFSGNVSMAQLDHKIERSFNQRALERIVSSEKAVTVAQGTFSGASPKYKSATVPTKISPAQFSSLRSNESFGTDKPEKEAPKHKAYRSPIPPGVSAKSFVVEQSSVEKQVEAAVGKEVFAAEMAQALPPPDEAGPPSDTNVPPPEGFHDKDSGQFAPKAGGVIDFNTAIYIEPPKDAVFDPNTQTFALPSNMGGINEHGHFINPENFRLNENGQFVSDGNLPPPPPGGEFGPDGPLREPTAKDGAPPPPPPMVHIYAHDVDQSPEEAAYLADPNAVDADGNPLYLPPPDGHLHEGDGTYDAEHEEILDELGDIIDDFNHNTYTVDQTLGGTTSVQINIIVQ